VISADSIRYMTRKTTKDTQEPLTVLELRDFLNRLIMGGCGDFKIIKPAGVFGTVFEKASHYTLNGHNQTVLLD